jgi:hypothetical protein
MPRKMPIHPLRIPMLERGLTQQELATAATKAGVAVSRSLVGMILVGLRKPTKEQARALSRAVGGSATQEAILTYEAPTGAMRQRRRRHRKP